VSKNLEMVVTANPSITLAGQKVPHLQVAPRMPWICRQNVLSLVEPQIEQLVGGDLWCTLMPVPILQPMMPWKQPGGSYEDLCGPLNFVTAWQSGLRTIWSSGYCDGAYAYEIRAKLEWSTLFRQDAKTWRRMALKSLWPHQTV
jgi:hypothetical protein